MPEREERLVWAEESGTRFASKGHWSPPFSIYEDRVTGKCVLTSGAPLLAGPVHTDSLNEAKSRAAALAAALREAEKP